MIEQIRNKYIGTSEEHDYLRQLSENINYGHKYQEDQYHRKQQELVQAIENTNETRKQADMVIRHSPILDSARSLVFEVDTNDPIKFRNVWVEQEARNFFGVLEVVGMNIDRLKKLIEGYELYRTKAEEITKNV